MKLVRFGPPGHERPGVWLDSVPGHSGTHILDVSAMAFDIHDYDSHFFAGGGLSRVAALLNEPQRKLVAVTPSVRLGPPVARPGKIICLGKNYAEHAKEFGGPVPDRPVFFSKAITALNGPFDPIRLPPQSCRVDGEAELAVVIGCRAKNLQAATALECVAGYTILNDVTDRDLQKAGQQWFMGKSVDTFCPLGPWLATMEEIPNPHALKIFSRLNGKTLQDGNSAHMIFNIPHVLAYATQWMTLEPGDILSTGTPSGIGSAREDPSLLKDGDVLETGVEKLGVQRSLVQRVF